MDHKPLTFAMAKVSEPWSAHQQCQLAYISEFTTDINHVADKDNHMADCLSQVIAGAVHHGIDYTRKAGDQASDPEVQALRTAVTELVWWTSSSTASVPRLCVTSPVNSQGWSCPVVGSVRFLMP